MNNPLTKLEEKEEALKEEFNNEQREALAIEEKIKELQAAHQQKIINMTRLQGAFSLLSELKDQSTEKETGRPAQSEQEEKT